MVIGLILAVICNANLFNVTSTLWLSKDARDSVTALAQIYGCKSGETCSPPDYQRVRQDMQENLNPLPLGYRTGSVQGYWTKLLGKHEGGYKELSGQIGSGLYTLGGWILTALAVSLGAPFWFDVLNNFVNLRLSGAKPAKAPTTP
jgi:hypothetical protein